MLGGLRLTRRMRHVLPLALTAPLDTATDALQKDRTVSIAAVPRAGPR
jgi:hypothetical protein